MIDSKPDSIPAWQREEEPSNTTPTSKEPTTDEPIPASQEDETGTGQSTEESTNLGSQKDTPSLVEQASCFLKDPDVRDAPRDKKVAFLQTKGLGEEDIRKLLGPEDESEGRTPTLRVVPKTWAKQYSKPLRLEQPPSPPRDAPPIITYPEFLTQPNNPPPLITISRILNTAYVASGLTASIWALSKYIITPMSEDLASARHDLAQHTQTRLEEFNKRLGSMVSTMPSPPAQPTQTPTTHETRDSASETESVESDPTELFHRDCGTQTSPSLSRRASVSSNSSSLIEETPLSTQQANITRVVTHLDALISAAQDNTASAGRLSAQADELRKYLNELSYTSPYYNYSYSGVGGPYRGQTGKKDDAAEAFKAEIRGVKGVLLNARNFPAGSPALAKPITSGYGQAAPTGITY